METQLSNQTWPWLKSPTQNFPWPILHKNTSFPILSSGFPASHVWLKGMSGKSSQKDKKAASLLPIFCRPFKTMPFSDPAWKFLPGGVPSTIINPKKHGMWVKQKINHPLLVITIFIYVVWLPFPVMAGLFMTLFYPHENFNKKTGITTACSHGIWVCLPASSPWIVCLPVRTARFGLDGIKEIMSKWPAK